jgi:hypothetical protein
MISSSKSLLVTKFSANIQDATIILPPLSKGPLSIMNAHFAQVGVNPTLYGQRERRGGRMQALASEKVGFTDTLSTSASTTIVNHLRVTLRATTLLTVKPHTAKKPKDRKERLMKESELRPNRPSRQWKWGEWGGRWRLLRSHSPYISY